VFGIFLVAPCLTALPLLVSPPRGDVISDTLDELWRAGRFEDLDQYIGSLVRSFPHYLPARLAEAQRVYHEGAQASRFGASLRGIRRDIGLALSAVPPSFILRLDAELRRADGLVRAYEAAGVDEGSLIDRLSARSVEPAKRASRWWPTPLLRGAPEVSIRTGGGVEVYFEPWVRAPLAGTTEVLREALLDPLADESVRLSSARGLGERGEALESLAHALADEDELVATASADALARAGAASVALMVEVLETAQSRDGTVCMMAAWGLLRNESASEAQLVQVLRNLRRDQRRPVAAYADEMLDYVGRGGR
jgi:hypothetical protein